MMLKIKKYPKEHTYLLKMKSFWVILLGWIAVGLTMLVCIYIYLNVEDFMIRNPVDQMVNKGYWKVYPFFVGRSTLVGFLIVLGCLIGLGLLWTTLVFMIKIIDEESKK